MKYSRAMTLAIKVLIVAVIVIGGTRVALEIDSHYQAPDWTGIQEGFGCPPGYFYDVGACMAYDPMQVSMDMLHNMIAFWPFGMLTLIGTAITIVNAPSLMKENLPSPH